MGSLLFQSPDGDFVYSDDSGVAVPLWAVILFQSPDGDFVYSDLIWFLSFKGTTFGFNPLTGISSILTRMSWGSGLPLTQVSIP